MHTTGDEVAALGDASIRTVKDYLEVLSSFPPYCVVTITNDGELEIKAGEQLLGRWTPWSGELLTTMAGRKAMGVQSIPF